MVHYPYLIVGAGMTGAAAVEGIRAVDPQGAIGLVGAEADPPYTARWPTTAACGPWPTAPSGSP